MQTGREHALDFPDSESIAPVLHQTVFNIVEMANPGTAKVAQWVELDPGMTFRLIALAASHGPASGFGVADLVEFVGVRAVIGIAERANLLESDPARYRIVHHCVEVARLSRAIAHEMGGMDTGEAYVAGLLAEYPIVGDQGRAFPRHALLKCLKFPVRLCAVLESIPGVEVPVQEVVRAAKQWLDGRESHPGPVNRLENLRDRAMADLVNSQSNIERENR